MSARRSPPIPMSAAPMVINSREGVAFPLIYRRSGSVKMVIPAIPWTTARVNVDMVLEDEIRVIIIATRPAIAKMR